MGFDGVKSTDTSYETAYGTGNWIEVITPQNTTALFATNHYYSNYVSVTPGTQYNVVVAKSWIHETVSESLGKGGFVLIGYGGDI